MLSTVAVVPEPPLLVPELATGAAVETAELRAACGEAVRRLAAASSTWIAVGADPGGRRTVGPGARGSFIGFGVDVVVGLAPDAAEPVDAEMALPLLVAAWLREGLAVTVRGELVAPDADPAACLALGAELARGATALLVVGDGAATHTEKAPGYLDERAGPFDDAVAAALAAADPAALAALDPTLAAGLWAAGRRIACRRRCRLAGDLGAEGETSAGFGVGGDQLATDRHGQPLAQPPGDEQRQRHRGVNGISGVLPESDHDVDAEADEAPPGAGSDCPPTAAVGADRDPGRCRRGQPSSGFSAGRPQRRGLRGRARGQLRHEQRRLGDHRDHRQHGRNASGRLPRRRRSVQ